MNVFYDNRVVSPRPDLIWSVHQHMFHEFPGIKNITYCEYDQADIYTDLICPINPSHELRVKANNLHVSIFNYRKNNKYIVMTNHGFDIVDSRLKKSYERRKLLGLNLSGHVTITDKPHIVDKFWQFHICGFAGIHWRLIRNGRNLRCQFCSGSTLLCHGCGRINKTCSVCRQSMLSTHPSSAKSFEYVMIDTKHTPIVNRSDWDGSDFSATQGDYTAFLVTKAGRRFLIKECPGLFYFKDAILDEAS